MDCVLKSFAYCLDLDTEDMLRYLGHNGREIINPELPEPYCYRGFNVHELIRLSYDHGYTVTEIRKQDYSYNCMMKEPKYIKGTDYVADYLGHNKYCLASRNHMIGVVKGKVLDVRGGLTDPKDFDYDTIYIFNWDWC